jgi:hypothetical protein
MPVILRKLEYFYIVLHTNFCMESVPKKKRRSFLSWKILKIKMPHAAKNEKLRTTIPSCTKFHKVQKIF